MQDDRPILFQITSTSDHEQFPSPDPLELTVGLEFDGWLSQIHTEIRELLSGRDSVWVNAVANPIDEVIYGRSPGIMDALHYETFMLGAPEYATFSFLLNNPGRIGQFAALEPKMDWNGASPPPERWERYAVFALMQLRACVSVLGARRQHPQPNEPARGPMNDYERAGSFAMEAMRGLQIGRALRQDARERSAKSLRAARKLHENRVALLDRAILIARSKPFLTKKAAAEEVVNQLPKDDKGTPYDLPTVLGWFRERGFVLVK